jgi:hypothetical protein
VLLAPAAAVVVEQLIHHYSAAVPVAVLDYLV